MSRARRPRGEAVASKDQSREIVAFLRGLAERVEQDAVFAAKIATLLRESGLLALDIGRPAARTTAARASKAAPTSNMASQAQAEAPNPFTILRERGEDGLRAALASLDLATLRQIVRAHRLDPARISARWTTHERVVTLIVDQVRARANLGRAFERV